MTPDPVQGTPWSSYHHAQALQWAAEHMNWILNQEAGQPIPDELRMFGSFVSAAILRAFSAELQLKALHEEEFGRPGDQTHDLGELFQGLRPETRTKLDGIYRVLVGAGLPDQDSRKSIERVFRDHSRDFETWRYIYENPGGASLDLRDLNYAIMALDQYHQARLSPTDDGADVAADRSSASR